MTSVLLPPGALRSYTAVLRPRDRLDLKAWPYPQIPVQNQQRGSQGQFDNRAPTRDARLRLIGNRFECQ